ncbi:copine-8-like [Oncorhynchus mykiss]|uniref:copine-8-like n=1 Tax=Oncorhynchus kisutch TaxID=8019 RepID=UPI0012DE9C86|nr:copine-8-like [Oncorhynchus kisutch]XP_036814942.1 copine-8-like [Oncorhynchus mykiss]
MSSFMNMACIGDFDPFTAAIPATKVELTVSCRNLLDRDTFSKSDPICVLYTQGISNREWREFSRTEVIDNTLNPDFVRKFLLDYFFEERQNLRFDLYDLDSKSDNLSKHDFLGQAFCTLGEVVGSMGSRMEKPLIGIPGKKCGTIIVRAEELSNCRESVMLQFCGNKLDKKDFFGKSDPFLVFYRSNEDGSFTICHKTEVVKNTLDPVWQAFKIPVKALCNGDYDRSIKVEVYDWDRDGGHDFIGEFSTRYREMSRGQSQFHTYEVVNQKKRDKKKKRYLNSGTVTLLSCLVDMELTFLDYIKGGTQINFTVAIDFTASNGNPSQPTSLHYMSPYQLNAYAMALRAVGEIIQDYDSDKMFPALGFGAKLPPDGRVSHEFALNGNPQNPYCSGIEGVMEAYYQSLKSVRLYGPTHFSPVINHVARYAQSVKDGSQYFILLIISDGVITDMAQTKESIVNAATLPMSIIIVGVGPAEFNEMIELDGDEERISSQGRFAERDIVQFVPFRDYIDRRGNHILSMARLAKEVLAEIPDQFLSYMRTRGIKPGPCPPAYTPTPALHPLFTRRVSRI